MKDELFENEPTVRSYRRANAVPTKVMAAFRRLVEANKRRGLDSRTCKGKDQAEKPDQ